MEHIDAILYINLEHRTDRNTHILKEIRKLCKDDKKIHRIDAIYKPELGILGCAMSHVKALQYILEHENWNNCLILEDDFTFKNYSSVENNDTINVLFDKFPDYDCCVLSYNPIALRCADTDCNIIKKVQFTQTASAYIISRKFINILLDNFKNGIIDMIHNGKRHENCIDIYWGKVQPSYNWYTFFPSLGYQMDSYSDIEQRYVAYKC